MMNDITCVCPNCNPNEKKIQMISCDSSDNRRLSIVSLTQSLEYCNFICIERYLKRKCDQNSLKGQIRHVYDKEHKLNLYSICRLHLIKFVNKIFFIFLSKLQMFEQTFSQLTKLASVKIAAQVNVGP